MKRLIGDYALIGDGQTAALVSNDGAVEWLCLPRFDSPACFAAMLGDEENGYWRIAPAGRITARKRRYRGDSLILETELSCAHGTLKITDFMPMRGEAPDIVRIAECIEGTVEVCSELRLRFDYGRIHPVVRSASGVRMLALSGPDAVSLDFDAPIAFEDRSFTSRFQLNKGERSRFVLTWFPGNEDPPERVDPQDALADTEAFWSDWVDAVEYRGQYRDAVIRSLITLKAMIHQPTGGILAAPTASLPERIEGGRNWDYRYCWLRDATFTLIALIRMGLTSEAGDWIGWLRRAAGGDPIDLRPFYSVTGAPRAIEWEADWLSGYAGSKPVRFGNDAQGQLQLDIYGEVIDCLYQAAEYGVAEGEDSDKLMQMLADKLAELWQQPDAGIWESRGEARQHTYSKVMCWVAFDRAAAWFEGSDKGLHRTYAELAEKAKALVLEKGWNEERGCFTRAFDDPALDAALLRLPMVGFLPADDARMAATISAIERHLCEDGLVRRYDPDETDDGISGSEGAFVAAGFWLADAMHLQGREEEARRLFEGLLARANDVGLLAEELDPAGDRQLGNFPQALSHLSLVRTAYRLEQGCDIDQQAAA